MGLLACVLACVLACLRPVLACSITNRKGKRTGRKFKTAAEKYGTKRQLRRSRESITDLLGDYFAAPTWGLSHLSRSWLSGPDRPKPRSHMALVRNLPRNKTALNLNICADVRGPAAPCGGDLCGPMVPPSGQSSAGRTRAAVLWHSTLPHRLVVGPPKTTKNSTCSPPGPVWTPPHGSGGA